MEQEVGGSSPPNCTTHRALDRANATIEASAVFSMTRLTDIRFSLPFSLPSFLANPSPFTHNSRSTASGGFAMAVRSRNFHVGLLLATALSVSLWPAASRAYTPEQEQACSGDAFRLCGSAFSRRRSRDRLHGPRTSRAHPALPRAVPAGDRAPRGCDAADGPADRDPTGDAAQGRQRQAAQDQAGETGGTLRIRAAFKALMRGRLTPCMRNLR